MIEPRNRPLRILVVGAGSIGLRHLRNVKALGATPEVFRYRTGLRSDLDQLGFPVPTFDNLADALASRPDGVVVANRTDLHLEVALAAARLGLPLFIEKPVSHSLAGLEELQDLETRTNLTIEVGFSMRSHPGLVRAREFILSGRLGQLHYASFRVGQYLPDWRPQSDYRLSYSAIRSQGGGALLDLIHEIDLARWFLGEVKDVSAMLAKSTELDIETESIAELGLRFSSGVLAQIHLDYLRPGYGRSFEIVGSGGILQWDYPSARLTFTDAQGIAEILFEVPSFDRNDMFLPQMRQFLNRILAPALAAGVSLADGIEAQNIVMAAHRSNELRRFVRPAMEDLA